MVIDKIVIRNIESHDNTTIDFKDGINAIIGSSGSGKSVVQRLFESFIYFKAMTLRYDSEWGGFEIHTPKGVISRYREDVVKFKCKACGKLSKAKRLKCGCGEKEYTVDRTKKYDIYSVFGVTLRTIRDVLAHSSIDDDPRTSNCCFEKMSRGFNNLSDEIIKALPFPLLNIRNGNPMAIGIKQQFDQFIWDELLASELSRLFSYLEGQDYVNDMVEFIKKDIKEDRALLKVIDPEILTLEEKLKDSKEVIERYKSDYEDTLKKKDAFSELYLSWDELQTVAGKYEAITTRGRKIKLELQDLKYKNFSKTEKLLREYKQIEVLLDQLEQLEEDVSVSECSLSLFSDKSIESIESDLRTLRTLKQLHLRFQEKKLQQEVTECKLNEITEDIANGKSEFEKLILSKNICPYSGFPLSKACKKLILEKI